MAENNEDFMKNLNNQFNDFVKNVFGESGAKFIEDTSKQVNEFSAQAIKGFVEFGDSVMKSTKLDENEMVRKSSDQIKDLLKQAGLLKEESEDEF